MQLGARWQAGSTPHRSVPAELTPSILDAEALHPEATSWTLTWLEGFAHCALDDVAEVTNAPNPNAHGALSADAEDDWLQ